MAGAVASPVGTHAGIGVDTQATKNVVDARQAPAAVRRQSRWYAGDSLKKGIKRFVIGVILLERGSKRSAMVPAAVCVNAAASLGAEDTAYQSRNKQSKARFTFVLWSCLSLLFFLATICRCLLLTLYSLFFCSPDVCGAHDGWGEITSIHAGFMAIVCSACAVSFIPRTSKPSQAWRVCSRAPIVIPYTLPSDVLQRAN